MFKEIPTLTSILKFFLYIFHFYNIDVVILNDNKNISNAQQLAEDVLAILTVFSAKMHGFRSHKNKNII